MAGTIQGAVRLWSVAAAPINPTQAMQLVKQRSQQSSRSWLREPGAPWWSVVWADAVWADAAGELSAHAMTGGTTAMTASKTNASARDALRSS